MKELRRPGVGSVFKGGEETVNLRWADPTVVSA